ncbi:MAG TPA: alpha/beta fold hydrolase [Gemmatimonadales bacterium]|jgi:pimeloyl-ACP methyl ester carboxylesterase
MTGRGVVLLFGIIAPAPAPARAQDAAPRLEHLTVTIDGEPLAVWARRPQHPRGAILLVHGVTWSSRPDFDLQVPGESRSVLAGLAARGYAAYAVDLRGYGGSPRDETGWLTPDRAADDVNEVLGWIAATAPMPKRPVLLGWSNGSLVSQLAAQRHPDRIAGLILYGYPLDPDDRFPSGGDPQVPPRERNTAADAASDFISPAVTSKATIEAYVAAALADDPIRTDWRRFDEWNALDPARVLVPTLLIQGERDPSIPAAALARLYARLGTRDKSRVTLKYGDHAALLETTTPTFIDAVTGFVDRVLR